MNDQTDEISNNDNHSTSVSSKPGRFLNLFSCCLPSRIQPSEDIQESYGIVRQNAMANINLSKKADDKTNVVSQKPNKQNYNMRQAGFYYKYVDHKSTLSKSSI